MQKLVVQVGRERGGGKVDEGLAVAVGLFEEAITWLQDHYSEFEFWTSLSAPGSPVISVRNDCVTVDGCATWT